MTTYRHWKVERDANGIAWLHLDKAGATTNVLSADVINELSAILDELDEQTPTGIVILSDKASGFIAGADVNEFTKLTTEDAALALIKKAHGIFNRLESFKCPTVALLHGFCLGGGMELALACRYRVADTDPKTRLGLPEVHPCDGGISRAGFYADRQESKCESGQGHWTDRLCRTQTTFYQCRQKHHQ